MRTDRDLVTAIKQEPEGEKKKALMYELFTRYEDFVHKHWHWLNKSFNKNDILKTFKEDFYGDSYVIMSKAVNAVDLGKIKNDKWKFLGYYGFYLSNHRNKYARKILKKFQEESLERTVEGRSYVVSDYTSAGVVDSAEEVIVSKDYKERFWKALNSCLSSWSDEDRQLFELRKKGTTIKVICETMNLSLWAYNKKIKDMKTQLLAAVESKQS